MDLVSRVRALVVSAIERAFPTQEPPSADELFDPELDRWRPFEKGEIQRVYGGKHWNQLQAQELREHPDWWVYFTPKAFKYYVPAYLILALDYNNADYAGFFLVQMTSQTKLTSLSERSQHLFSALSETQLDSIRDWQQFLILAYPDEIEPVVPGSLVATLHTCR